MSEIKIEKLVLKESSKVRGGTTKQVGRESGDSGISTDACSCCCPPCPSTDPEPW